MSNGSKPAVETPPDVLGDEGRIEAVAGMLGTIQKQIFDLRVEAAANGWGDDDDVGPKPGASRDQAETLSEKRDRLQAAQRRLLDEFSDLMPRVQRVLDRQKG